MLGGIIGDLAADTYLRDKKTFYRQLFDEHATLSEYGLSVLATSSALNKICTGVISGDKTDLQKHIASFFHSADKSVVHISTDALSWLDYFSFSYSGTDSGMLLNRLATHFQVSESKKEDL